MFKSKPKETPAPAQAKPDPKAPAAGKDAAQGYAHPFATKDDKIAAAVASTAKAVVAEKPAKAAAAPAPAPEKKRSSIMDMFSSKAKDKFKQ